MRIPYVMPLLILGWITLLGACVPKPAAAPLPDRFSMSLVGIESTAKSLWFTTSNFSSGGKLGRVDFKSGLIERSVLAIGADTVIFADTSPGLENGLILLTRMGQDAVTILRGARAEVVAHHPLPKMINPQGAARDALGRVWVTSQGSNHVLVLSPDLKEEIASNIDLSSLQASTTPSARADLAQIAPLNSTHMVVSAQRLDRGVGTWKPQPQSGLARINTETLKVEFAGLVDATNPIQLAVHNEKVILAGAGDFSSPAGARGKVATLGGPLFAIEAAREYGAKIIAADLETRGAPATVIAWYADQKRSCIEVGTVQVVCDGNEQNQGYVFGAVRRSGRFIFVSYVALGAAELWIIEIDSSQQLRALEKKTMDMPIQSMSFGP